MKLIKITKKGSVKPIEKDNINFLSKNKNISKLYSWDYNNSKLVLYGCIDGDAGEENKYDLPPPCDCELYFNDLYFLKYNNNEIVDLTREEYNNFYVYCFEGFESIDSTDDEIEEELSEHTSDRDFINDDEISICSETNDIELTDISDFTSDDNKKTTTDEYKDDEEDLDEEEEDNISSIEITISSCSDIDDEDLESIEDDVDTE
jgi:hypothetical protein